MAAWLQIHVHGTAASSGSSLLDRYNFRVTKLVVLVKALAYNFAIFHEDRAHHWIRAGETLSAASEFNCVGHPFLIFSSRRAGHAGLIEK
jgi:hypothetical protein